MSSEETGSRGSAEGKGEARRGERQPEEIRQEIEEARDALGETVAAVAERTDAKKQARAKAEGLAPKARELRDGASAAAPDSAEEGARQAQRAIKENPVPFAVAGALLALVIGRGLSR